MNKRRTPTIPELAAGLLCLVGGAWLSWLLFIQNDLKLQSAALKGDAFGGLNTLFAGLAFAGAFLALFKQHQDTKEAERQRREDKAEEQTHREREDEEKRQERERERQWQGEADVRPRESLAAQERIAVIQASTALLATKADLLKRFITDEAGLSELSRLYTPFSDQWRDNAKFHSTILAGMLGKNHDELTGLLTRFFGKAVLVDEHFGTLDEKLRKRIAGELDFARGMVEELNKEIVILADQLEEASGLKGRRATQ